MHLRVSYDSVLLHRYSLSPISENVPARDLWVSPHHAMYLDGLLIEAKDLVNDASIYQADVAESVTYFHVELDSHDVILAEGAWAESFIDHDGRGMFHNAQEYAALYPDKDATSLPRYYAPRLESGLAVERVRETLDARLIYVRTEQDRKIA